MIFLSRGYCQNLCFVFEYVFSFVCLWFPSLPVFYGHGGAEILWLLVKSTSLGSAQHQIICSSTVGITPAMYSLVFMVYVMLFTEITLPAPFTKKLETDVPIIELKLPQKGKATLNCHCNPQQPCPRKTTEKLLHVSTIFFTGQ